jgi:hypothetical protein
MRNWKMALLFLSLAVEGMLVAKLVYSAGGQLTDHQCLQADCTTVWSYNCAGGAKCTSTNSGTFWTCQQSAGYVCQNDATQFGSTTCAGTCPDINNTPCNYTFDHCQ